MIENTSNRDPEIHILGALGGLDNYISGMESAGQKQIVHSDRLPTNMQGNSVQDFLNLGFTFDAPDPKDPLFRAATLPEGWKREGSDHAMWSHIVDTNGRQRVSIFYKAAFYDRHAFMSIRSPRAEFTELSYGDMNELPVDDWTPRELWIALLTAERESLLTEATERDSYYPEGAAKSRKHAAICDRELTRLGGTR